MDPAYAFDKNMTREERMGGVLFGFSTYYPGYYDSIMIDHLGSMGGQTSMMTWLPEEGISIMVAVNDDWTYGHEFVEITSFRIVDELLRLNKPRGSSYIRGPFAREIQATPPVSPAPPTVDILGSYIDDGGLLEPVPISLQNETLTRVEELILSTMATQMSVQLNLTSMYITNVFNIVKFNKLVFTHWDANHWNWTAIRIHPPRQIQRSSTTQSSLSRDPDHEAVVEIVETASLEVKDSGLKMQGVFWDICAERYISIPDARGGHVELEMESFAPRVDRERIEAGRREREAEERSQLDEL